MGITKTLGGDRLGAGKKMQVHMHGFERSTHDLGFLWRSTMAPGTLVPFMSEIALPGDTFDINLECDIKTHPTIGPLFGSYKVQLDVFLAPIRLYNAQLHNNALGIGMNIAQVKFPLIRMRAGEPPAVNSKNIDWDNLQINPSSLLAYLGIRGIGIGQLDNNRYFNAIPLLAYWEIYKQYYSNKMEEIGAVIHTPIGTVIAIDGLQILDQIGGTPENVPVKPGDGTAYLLGQGYQIILDYSVGGVPPIPAQVMVYTQQHGLKTADDLTGGNWTDDTINNIMIGTFDYNQFGQTWIEYWNMRSVYDLGGGKPAVDTFPLENIDTMRNEILQQPGAATFEIDASTIAPYGWIADTINEIPNYLSPMEGLGLKTYQSDLFNNWLNTEWIDGTNGITEITSIDTTGGSFTLDTLNLSKKVYDMLNRIAVSGGTYNDWVEVQFDHKTFVRAENPMYMGGLIKELVFQEVVSNSESGDQALGTLAGKGILSKKHKGGHIVVKVDEPSYIMGIISLTPRIDYSQGNKWDVHLKTMADLHVPSMDEIGFQDLITEQMAWWDTIYDGTNWVQRSAGKQPAWINYMTNVNRNFGNFAINNNEMFMTLNRRYEHDEVTGNIKDLTTYIDPSKYNNIFAQTSLDAQNFWAQIAVDITARRKMSARLMPNI